MKKQVDAPAVGRYREDGRDEEGCTQRERIWFVAARDGEKGEDEVVCAWRAATRVDLQQRRSGECAARLAQRQLQPRPPTQWARPPLLPPPRGLDCQRTGVSAIVCVRVT